MKILCVADHVDPLVYSPNIKERFKDVTMVLGAGDLDVAYYEYIISCLNKPLRFVFGNHNLKLLSRFSKRNTFPDAGTSWNTVETFFGSVSVDGKIVVDKKNDLIIAGLGGSLRYNWGEHQFTERQMLARAFRLIPRMIYNKLVRGRWIDILLTHAPPRGIHDRDDLTHRGFFTFVWFIKAFKPRYLIHGHVHLYNVNEKRFTRYGPTLVVNAYDHVVLDWEADMARNVYLDASVNQDFEKAKRRGWTEGINSVLNPEFKNLLSFHDVKSLLQPKKENYRGMMVVPVSAIVGSEDRYQDFSRHFFPKKEHLRNRWTSIDEAFHMGINLPPIKLYKIGDAYFVRDGNHRVSVARTQGALSIDAEVVELTSEIPVMPGATREEIIRGVIEHERSRVLEQTGLDKMIPMEGIEFTTPGRYHEMLNHILGHKYYLNLDREGEIPLEEAAKSWFDNLYVPVLAIIRKEKLLSRFKGRTEGDIYLWVVKHWHSLKEKYGPEYPLEQAAAEYSASHGKGFWSRVAEAAGIFFRKNR